MLITLALFGCSSDFDLQTLDDSVQPVDTGYPEEEPSADEPQADETPEEPEADEPATDEDPADPYTDDPPAVDDCEHTSDLVYVIDRETDQLYLFDPDSLALTLLGELDCTRYATPGSMGVGRDGTGYVRYSDESVFEVDLETLDCSPTGYSNRSFGSFGMGFATDSADTWRDSLYVANATSLARLDIDSWSLRTMGTLPSQSELTGNADGELWAFLPLERPAELVELNKASGAALRTVTIPSFPNPSNIDAFAFVNWGGSFYLFVREYGMGRSTDIYEVRPDGTTTVVATDIGLHVVGAGVSTCAPTE